MTSEPNADRYDLITLAERTTNEGGAWLFMCFYKGKPDGARIMSEPHPTECDGARYLCVAFVAGYKFHDARATMIEIVRKYYPWIYPLLEKNI